MMPIVSIVIPTYKRPDLLYRCLAALTHQHFPANLYEIIVVSDGPDVLTHELVQEFGEKNFDLVFFTLPMKKGPAAARNLGWQSARGKLILFTDDDCMPGSDWIKSYYNAWIGWPQEPVTFTGRITVPRSPQPTDYEKNTAQLESAGFVTANCACTKTALEIVQGFDESFTMAWREDSDLEFKLIAKQIPIAHIEQASVVHPVREAPWGVSIKEQRKSMFNALLFKKHPSLYRQKIRAKPLWNYYAIIFLSLVVVVAALAHWIQLMVAALVGWMALEVSFIMKRLSGADRSPRHIAEMVVTSLIIPFLSVYWTLYGSVRFKTRFL
jgi:glycosyltransferase involved in cell wall biosynthesis